MKEESPKFRGNSPPRGQAFATAVIAEAGLGLLGVVLAWALGISLVSELVVSRGAVLRGLAACGPMLMMLAALELVTWEPIERLRQLVDQFTHAMFRESRWWELALVCVAAGVGEEVFFRGTLQAWISGWTNPYVALLAVSIAFGLLHAITPTYFILATLIGLYLGALALVYDDLIAPIVAHTVYDFVALVYAQRRVRGG
jgi:hypothetical protein